LGQTGQNRSIQLIKENASFDLSPVERIGWQGEYEKTALQFKNQKKRVGHKGHAVVEVYRFRGGAPVNQWGRSRRYDLGGGDKEITDCSIKPARMRDRGDEKETKGKPIRPQTS